MIASSIFFCFRLKYNFCIRATVSQETAACVCMCRGRAIGSVDGTEDTHSSDTVCTYVNRHFAGGKEAKRAGQNAKILAWT